MFSLQRVMGCVVTSSVLLTTLVVVNAYYQKSHFYSMMIYIANSKASLAALYFQMLVILGVAGKMFRTIFFGELSSYERENLRELMWDILADSCFALALKTDFNLNLTLCFNAMFYLKIFHGLFEERISVIQRNLNIPWTSHLRTSSLIFALLSIDILLMRHGLKNDLIGNQAWLVGIALECSILLITVANVSIKYILHCFEIYREIQWESKEGFIIYVNVILGIMKMIVHSACGALLFINSFSPVYVIRPFYASYETVRDGIKTIIRTRKAVRVMKALFPSATNEDLALVDTTCVICRENMLDPQGTKKLPCGHIFHTGCVRQWFQRQQKCPTCRKDILNVDQSEMRKQVSRYDNTRIYSQDVSPNSDSSQPNSFATSPSSIISRGDVQPFARLLSQSTETADCLETLSREELRRLIKEGLMKRLELLEQLENSVHSLLVNVNQLSHVMETCSVPENLQDAVNGTSGVDSQGKKETK